MSKAPEGDRILLFPVSTPDSILHAKKIKQNENKIIFAGDSKIDSIGGMNESIFSDFIKLPYIYDPGFFDSLSDFITKNNIGKIKTSHIIVYNFLQEMKEKIPASIEIYVEDEIFEENYYADYSNLSLGIFGDESVRRPLTLSEFEQTLRSCMRIPGQSAVFKLISLLVVGRAAPSGDLVEIGSFYGRSAMALSRLAAFYAVGPVLCVDPWSDESASQDELPMPIKSAFARIDYQDVFKSFVDTMRDQGGAKLNYCRRPSQDVAMLYQRGFEVKTELGKTKYGGQISILHIDGNHDFTQASADLETWSRWISPGGWLLVDDYEWAFSNGPKEATDAWVAKGGRTLKTSFIVDGTYFAQLL